MPDSVIAPRLRRGDRLCVVSASRSLAMTSPESVERARGRLNNLGFACQIGEHALEVGAFSSSSAEHRVEDIHRAFAHPEVRGVLSAIGGFNSNQLLGLLDFELIARSPKVFCGRSDITVLLNAIYARTGLITYHGPHFSNFGIPEEPTYTIDSFLRMTTADAAQRLEPPREWTDDRWWVEQGRRGYMLNHGPVVLQAGTCEGTILGGNLSSFVLLAGTRFWPEAQQTVLVLEELGFNPRTLAEEFDRHLQCVLQQVRGGRLAGLVLGKFIGSGNLTLDNLREIIASKRELRGVPVIAELDFGHTEPRFTFPVGGTARLAASEQRVDLIISH